MTRGWIALFGLGLLLLLLLLGGCAGMMASWRQANCNYDGAYKAGMNDARQGGQMRANFSHPCLAQVRAEVERGYREGYTAGVGGSVAMVGGGGAAVVMAGSAPGPRWRCVEAYGEKRCGYSCVQAYGKIACARERHHTCVQAHGEVGCGPNCRAEYGKIVCDW